MRALSELELLNAWEQGQCQTLPYRALILLASSCPETPIDSIGRLSIGKRDDFLLTLREWTFGSRLVGLAACPKCANPLELDFEADDVRAETEAESEKELSFTVSGYDLLIRSINTYDILSIACMKDVPSARDALLNCCILEILSQGVRISLDQLPSVVIDAVAEKMEQIDPQADIRLVLSCPACGHNWEALFDIVSFFWNEIDSWARHILREVHTLAQKYGWSESDILSMSPQRRRIYLEMANQ